MKLSLSFEREWLDGAFVVAVVGEVGAICHRFELLVIGVSSSVHVPNEWVSEAVFSLLMNTDKGAPEHGFKNRECSHKKLARDLRNRSRTHSSSHVRMKSDFAILGALELCFWGAGTAHFTTEGSLRVRRETPRPREMSRGRVSFFRASSPLRVWERRSRAVSLLLAECRTRARLHAELDVLGDEGGDIDDEAVLGGDGAARDEAADADLLAFEEVAKTGRRACRRR